MKRTASVPTIHRGADDPTLTGHAGLLLVSLAESMLAGGSHLAHLDSLREDEAGRVLRAVAQVPAPETASQLLPRFTVRQCQGVVAELARGGAGPDAGTLAGGTDDPGSRLHHDRGVWGAEGGRHLQLPGEA
ncbi:MAG TPA: hypothetical protein VNF24_08385 [Candidatus Acidoferrales bacterium]|nr:hypothetical protein [Candidatus Acidoferrales bacterium]